MPKTPAFHRPLDCRIGTRLGRNSEISTNSQESDASPGGKETRRRSQEVRGPKFPHPSSLGRGSTPPTYSSQPAILSELLPLQNVLHESVSVWDCDVLRELTESQ